MQRIVDIIKGESMDFEKNACEYLLDQVGKRKFNSDYFVCHYFGNFPNSICEGMSAEHFENICKTLCLICRGRKCDKVVYNERICTKFLGSSKMLFYNLSNSYSDMLYSENKLPLPWEHPEFDTFLNFCVILEVYDYTTVDKKELLKMFALLFYKCDDDITKKEDWYEPLITLKTKTLEIEPIFSAENVKISFAEICETLGNKHGGLFQSFGEIITQVMAQDKEAFLIKKIFEKTT